MEAKNVMDTINVMVSRSCVLVLYSSYPPFVYTATINDLGAYAPSISKAEAAPGEWQECTVPVLIRSVALRQ